MNTKLLALALMVSLLGLVGTADAHCSGHHHNHFGYNSGDGGYGAGYCYQPNHVNQDPSPGYWENYWANLGSYNHVYWPSLGYTNNMNNCFNQ